MAPPIDMEQAARLCGYSWERFRKVWRALPGFPVPIKRPSLTGKGAYAWVPHEVEAWRDARKRALACPVHEPANDRYDVVLADRAAATRQRKALRGLLTRA